MHFNDYISIIFDIDTKNKFKSFFIVGNGLKCAYNICNINEVKIVNNGTSRSMVNQYLNLSLPVIIDSINVNDQMINKRINILRKLGYDVNCFFINEINKKLHFDNIVLVRNKKNIIDNEFIKELYDKYRYLFNSSVKNNIGDDIKTMMLESSHKYLTDGYYDIDCFKKNVDDFMDTFDGISLQGWSYSIKGM